MLRWDTLYLMIPQAEPLSKPLSYKERGFELLPLPFRTSQPFTSKRYIKAKYCSFLRVGFSNGKHNKYD